MTAGSKAPTPQGEPKQPKQQQQQQPEPQKQEKQSAPGTDEADATAMKIERTGDARLSNARELHLEARFYQAEKEYVRAAETFLQARSATTNDALRKRIGAKADKALRGAEQLKNKHSSDGILKASTLQRKASTVSSSSSPKPAAAKPPRTPSKPGV